MHWLHHMCVCNVYIQINHSVTCVSCLSVTWCLYVCHLPSQYIFCRFTCVMQNVLSARAGYQRQFSHRRANGTKPFFLSLGSLPFVANSRQKVNVQEHIPKHMRSHAHKQWTWVCTINVHQHENVQEHVYCTSTCTIVRKHDHDISMHCTWRYSQTCRYFVIV